MGTTEKILETMNSWEWGELIIMDTKKSLGASSHYIVGAFKQEKALVGDFSVIVKSSWTFVYPSFQALSSTPPLPWLTDTYILCQVSLKYSTSNFKSRSSHGTLWGSRENVRRMILKRVCVTPFNWKNIWSWNTSVVSGLNICVIVWSCVQYFQTSCACVPSCPMIGG